MTRWQESTRVLCAVSGSEIKASDQTISLAMLDQMDRSLNLVFALAAVPAVISLLASRLDEMTGHIPPEERPMVQTLACTEVQFGMDEHANIGLMLKLQGGGFLPIQFGRETLRNLYQAIGEALDATDTERRN